MKSPVLLIALAGLVAAVGFLRPEARDHQTIQPEQRVKSRTRPVDLPFWKNAVVPEPHEFRYPFAVANSSPAPPPVDYPENVARIAAAGDPFLLNQAVADWFEADPAAARDWLATRSSLDDFEPALIRIAGHIARSGDGAQALDWTAILPDGPEKNQLLFDIYSFAARSHQFTADQLRAAPLEPDQVARLLGGAADD